MLNEEIKNILGHSQKHGWVLEPDAKRLLKLAGIKVPKFSRATTIDDALDFSHQNGYPVVAKVVSPEAIHKSDVGGVALGISDDGTLTETFERFSAIKGFCGMLVEESLSGFELIVGAKVDYQFGPVVLLGIGGTGVEIYRDTVLRMAPLRPEDAASMLKGLKAHQLLEGYRGSEPVNVEQLTRLLITFSALVMEIEPYIETIDLNPVMCLADQCVVVDARIILNG
ncbi:MAG: acetate--CoA ligase family protein [Desulfobacterales bacterium]